MARKNETATSRVMNESDAPVARTEKLVSGKHITSSALAMVLAGSAEEKRLDTARLENLKLMIEASTDKEVDEAIRSAKEDEKIMGADGKPDPDEPVNYGPTVAKLVKLGMTLKTAKVRMSETRSTIRAIRVGFTISPKDGWHKTVTAARLKLAEKADADAKIARDVLAREMLAEGLLKHGDDIAAARRYADAQMEQHDAEAEEKEELKDVDRLVKRLLKLDNSTLLVVCTKALATINYNVVIGEKPVKSKGKAATVKAKGKATPVEVPPMEREPAKETAVH